MILKLKAESKQPAEKAGCLILIVVPISRILFPPKADGDHLSVAPVARRIKRHSPIAQGTALHRGKDLAVSAGLNRVVSVRTSWIAPGGRYPLPFPLKAELCSDFPPRPKPE